MPRCAGVRHCRTAWLALSLMLLAATAAMAADKPKPELLWPNGAPGAKGDKPADKPTMTMFAPDPKIACGAAVVICPGGGYGGVAFDYEGVASAKRLNTFGMTCFVVDYRTRGRGYGHPAPLQDAQRAVRIVRSRAAELKLDPTRIGIMGFSAGGHLASSVGTHFDLGDPKAADPIERVSCRPDFMVLCYPVIAFGEPYTHYGSQFNLLTQKADPALVKSMSSEKQVTPQTPPTFLFTTDGDTEVPPENSVQFYLALRRVHVPAELHVFLTGRHGLSLAPGVPGTSEWSNLLNIWLHAQGIVDDNNGGPFPGRKSQWMGYDRYDFHVDGRPCFVVAPKKAAPGKPWIWRTEFFGHEPQGDLALLAKGFHAVYIDVQNMYGAPVAIKHMDAFYDFLTTKGGLSKKTVLEGFSRGGLFAFNWAAAHPDRVACLYVDAPVCDIKSWPGGKGKGCGSAGDWKNCQRVYGMTEAQALAYKHNPVDNLEPLARAGIPILSVVGAADKVVPVAENTAIVEQRYKALGGTIQVISKPGCDHHPHSLKDPKPIVDFVLEHTKTK